MSFQSAAENLEELLADLRLLPALSWDKLPTFGGTEPGDTTEIWSWDAERLLVGTCRDDLEIIDREELT